MEQVFTKSGRRLLSRRGVRAALAERFRAYLARVYFDGSHASAADAIRAIAADFDVTERQVRKWLDPDLDTLPGLEILAVCAGFEAVERLFDGCVA